MKFQTHCIHGLCGPNISWAFSIYKKVNVGFSWHARWWLRKRYLGRLFGYATRDKYWRFNTWQSPKFYHDILGSKIFNPLPNRYRGRVHLVDDPRRLQTWPLVFSSVQGWVNDTVTPLWRNGIHHIMLCAPRSKSKWPASTSIYASGLHGIFSQAIFPWILFPLLQDRFPSGNTNVHQAPPSPLDPERSTVFKLTFQEHVEDRDRTATSARLHLTCHLCARKIVKTGFNR